MHGGALAALAIVALLCGGPSRAADCPAPPSTANATDVRSFGAKGDGVTDDTAAIQSALRGAQSGATIHVPPGKYLIRVSSSPRDGLWLKNGVTLVMDPAAVLQALPTKDGTSAIIRVWGVGDVRVFGGTLIGERNGHLGKAGEWGMGLDVRDAQRVLVVGTVARDTWGDGFYFGGKANADIQVCGVTADGNRRNGMSIVAATRMTVLASRFLNTYGTLPEAGVDIEPDENLVTEDIVIAHSVFEGNRGSGVGLTASCFECGAVNRNNTIRDNVITGNWGDGIRLVFDGHRIENNTIEDSGRAGILLWRADKSVVRGNTVRRSKSAGLRLEGARDNRLEANTLEDNRRAIDVRVGSNGNEITRNRCAGRGTASRRDRRSTANRFEDNDGCGRP